MTQHGTRYEKFKRDTGVSNKERNRNLENEKFKIAKTAKFLYH